MDEVGSISLWLPKKAGYLVSMVDETKEQLLCYMDVKLIRSP